MQAIAKHQAEKEQKEETRHNAAIALHREAVAASKEREEAQAARHRESTALARETLEALRASLGGAAAITLPATVASPRLGAGTDMARQLQAAAEDTAAQGMPEGIAIAILLADMTAVYRQHGLTLVPEKDDARALLLTVRR